MSNSALNISLDMAPFSSNTVNLITDASQLSAGNWGGGDPSDLQNLIDTNLATSTTAGKTEGSGNKGWIKADLFISLSGSITLKFSIKERIEFPPPGTKSCVFFVEGSNDNSTWTSLFTESVGIPVAETFYDRNYNFIGYRWLRIGLLDTGNGAAEFRGYEWRVSV